MPVILGDVMDASRCLRSHGRRAQSRPVRQGPGRRSQDRACLQQRPVAGDTTQRRVPVPTPRNRAPAAASAGRNALVRAGRSAHRPARPSWSRPCSLDLGTRSVQGLPGGFGSAGRRCPVRQPDSARSIGLARRVAAGFVFCNLASTLDTLQSLKQLRRLRLDGSAARCRVRGHAGTITVVALLVLSPTRSELYGGAAWTLGAHRGGAGGARDAGVRVRAALPSRPGALLEREAAVPHAGRRRRTLLPARRQR